jgi:excisionase family DNA binding protein
MESPTRILTISEVAQVLRCSKAHVNKALNGRIAGVPQLAHLSLGRRKLIPKDWFDQWLEESRNKTAAHGTNTAEAAHGSR